MFPGINTGGGGIDAGSSAESGLNKNRGNTTKIKLIDIDGDAAPYILGAAVVLGLVWLMRK